MYSICNATNSSPIYAVCRIPRHLHNFVLLNKLKRPTVFICDNNYFTNYIYSEFDPVYSDLYTAFTDLDRLIVDLELREGAIDGENIYIASSSKQQCLEVIRKISASISDDVERYICEVV